MEKINSQSIPDDLKKLIKVGLYLNERKNRVKTQNKYSDFWSNIKNMLKGPFHSIIQNPTSLLIHNHINCHETALRYIYQDFQYISKKSNYWNVKEIQKIFPDYLPNKYSSFDDLKQIFYRKLNHNNIFYGQVQRYDRKWNLHTDHSFLTWIDEQNKINIFEKVGFDYDFELNDLKNLYLRYNNENYKLLNYNYQINLIAVGIIKKSGKKIYK